ncbi:MAG: hypothetical protein ACFFBE_14745 [Promethearchaeota archaeon]
MERGIKVISIIGKGYLGKQIIEKSLLFNYDIKAFDVNQESLNSFTEKKAFQMTNHQKCLRK